MGKPIFKVFCRDWIMKYDIHFISREKKEKIISKLALDDLYQTKADVHGICIKLFTDNYVFKSMWLENFKFMLDGIRPHGRIFAINDGKKFEILYEASTKTVIMKNCDYYGWLKSIALALANEYLEDVPSEHRRYSIHGSSVDYDGRGIGIIGPSGSGKTTLTYGLLLNEKFNFITDDWFFVRLKRAGTMIYSSEKNSYLRDGLEKDWPQFKKKLDGMEEIKKDNKKRFIVDVKKLFGDDRVLPDSDLKAIILLVRDKKLKPIKKLTKKQALDFMSKHNFCNPHQLIRNIKKKQMRTEFFSELFSRVPVYMLNTVETPKQSLNRIIELCERHVI